VHTYDLNVILDPLLSETQLQTEKDAITSQVQRNNGEIVELQEPGRQRLAYEIRKGREGYYLFYTLKLAGDAPKAIEAALKVRDNVMRVLVVRDRPEWKTLKARKPRAEAPQTAPAAQAATPNA
jgi:small subunit ribosomal protein S6